MESEHLHIDHVPDLREPVLLAAFAGWNDASQVATFALTSLVKTWSAERFADIDAEPFYDFTETRPTISLDPARQRQLKWPSNAFYAHRVEESDRDLVLLIGIEPQLQWRRFCATVVHLADRVEASRLLTVGGLLADVPHTVEPRLTGFASTPDLLSDLRKLGVQMSSYEGPTGILGVLHDAWQRSERPALSLWGNVPHYISAAPNPQISLALLERIASLLGITLSVEGLQERARAFRAQVDEALAENPEATEYVRQLEQHFGDEAAPQPAPQLLEELEEYLRRRRPQTPDEE